MIYCQVGGRWPTKSKPKKRCAYGAAAFSKKSRRASATGWLKLPTTVEVKTAAGKTCDIHVLKLQLQTSHGERKVKN